MKKDNHQKVSKLLLLLTLATLFTACTTTKHLLKRTTEKVKVYNKSEVIASYDLKGYPYNTKFDADRLVGFSFTEKSKKHQDTYPNVALPPEARPIRFKDISVNIDLCKHWKKTSFRENPLEERAYSKNFSNINNPTQYTLFISWEKLKKKKLVATDARDQEDICIYIDSEYSGHFGRFKDKSNKIRYKASEINALRVEFQSL